MTSVLNINVDLKRLDLFKSVCYLLKISARISDRFQSLLKYFIIIFVKVTFLQTKITLKLNQKELMRLKL